MTKKLTSVEAVLAAMIGNWPTLMSTRNDALRHLFTNTGTEWAKEGYPLPSAAYEASTRNDEDEDQAATDSGQFYKGEEKAAHEARGRLRARRHNQKIAFTRDNAALLAIEPYSAFSYVPTFSTYELNRLPLDKLNDDWKGALIEFCNAILDYSVDDALRHHRSGMSPDYIERSVQELKQSHAVATECIARFGISKNKNERNVALEKLRAEAAKFGFNLTKIESEL